MTKQYGVDVAAVRADDLDKKCLKSVASLPNSSILELGCGSGGQTLRMAEAGGVVTAVDIKDYSKQFTDVKHVTFIQSDIRNLNSTLGTTFNFCLLQRTVHYLQYDEALNLLRFLRTIVTDNLFISVTGIDSDIGEQYVGRNHPIQERFHCLEVPEQEIFSISEPICLYTPVEFMELLTQSGWVIEECWTSAFGNVKAVCS